MINLSKQHNISKFIFASSSSVYGDKKSFQSTEKPKSCLETSTLLQKKLMKKLVKIFLKFLI